MEDNQLRAQVAALEARVAVLEARLRISARAPTPDAVPEAVHPENRKGLEKTRPSQSRVAAEKSGDLERFFGISVLGRVGIAAVLLAAGYFGQLGWTNLGPGARATLIYLAGFMMIGLGALLRSRVAQVYTALLFGGGTAMTYLAGVLAHLRYEVLSSTVALASLLASVAIGQFLAIRLGEQAMATIALFGAYLAPVLVLRMDASPTGLLILLLTLHAWAAWTELRFQWTTARGFAVSATTLIGLPFLLQQDTLSPLSLLVHLQVLWLGLVAPELFRAFRGHDASPLRALLVLFVGLVIQCLAYLRSFHDVPVSGIVLGTLLLGGGAWFQLRALELGISLARLGAILLPFGALAWRSEDSIWALLAASVVLAATGRWTRVAATGIGVAALLAFYRIAMFGPDDTVRLQTPFGALIPLMLCFVAAIPGVRIYGLCLAVLTVLIGLRIPITLLGHQGIWSAAGALAACAIGALGLYLAARRQDQALRIAAVLVQVLAMLLWGLFAVLDAVWGISQIHGAWPLWNLRTGTFFAMFLWIVLSRDALPVVSTRLRTLHAIVLLVSLFLAGLFELLDAVVPLTFGARSVAVSLYMLLFAAGLLTAGFRIQSPRLRWTALYAFSFVALKVVLHDLSGLDASLRILATGVLGLVLLTAALAYARLQRRSV